MIYTIFSDISDELVTDMKDSVLNRLNADEQSLVKDFYVKHMKIKRYRRKTRHFRDECQAKTFQGAKKIVLLSNEEIEKQKI